MEDQEFKVILAYTVSLMSAWSSEDYLKKQSQN